jgi:hypothetical protein
MRRATGVLGTIAIATMLGGIAVVADADEVRRDAGPALDDGQTHAGPKLRGGELRACVRLNLEIDAIDSEIRILRGPLDAAAWDHERKGRSLDADEPHLDRTDHDAVARYNERVGAHADAVAAYNALLPAFNGVVTRQGGMVERFNDSCAERAYFKKEWWAEALRLQRQAAQPR